MRPFQEDINCVDIFINKATTAGFMLKLQRPGDAKKRATLLSWRRHGNAGYQFDAIWNSDSCQKSLQIYNFINFNSGSEKNYIVGIHLKAKIQDHCVF